MAGLFDLLMGGGGANPLTGMAQQNPLQRLLDPSFALPMAAGMMGNQGNAGNIGQGFQNAMPFMMQARKDKAQTAERNKTLEYLQKSNPELAQMVASGMPMNEAWDVLAKQRFAKSDSQNLINAGDGRIYDPVSKQWITAPDAIRKPPQVVELFDEGTGQPYKATWNPETNKYERVGGVKARSGMSLRTNPDGSVEFVQGDLSGNLPKLTEAEGRNAGFYGRGVKSNEVLQTLEGQGTSVWNNTVGKLPVAGNYALSADAQKYTQAKRDFINAVLRRESGAVISEEEFANAEQQYFPQPGDGEEVIKQKRANRETTLRGLEISGGQGSPFATQPPSAGAQPGPQQAPTDSGGGWQDLGDGVRIRPIQ